MEAYSPAAYTPAAYTPAAYSPPAYAPAPAIPTGYGSPIPLTPVILDTPYASTEYEEVVDVGAGGGGGGGGGGGLIIAPGLGIFEILKLVKKLVFLLPLIVKVPIIVVTVVVVVVVVVRVAVVVVPVIAPGFLSDFFERLKNPEEEEQVDYYSPPYYSNNDYPMNNAYPMNTGYPMNMAYPMNAGYGMDSYGMNGLGLGGLNGLGLDGYDQYSTDQYPGVDYNAQDYGNYRKRRQMESGAPYFTVKQLERLSSVVLAALREQECVQRLLCEAGSISRNYSTIVSVTQSIRLFVPETMKPGYEIFAGAESCARYLCGDLKDFDATSADDVDQTEELNDIKK